MAARLNTEFKGHASILYTEMKEIHGRRNWQWWKSQIIQKYRNSTWIWQKTMSFKNEKYSVDKSPYKWCLKQLKRAQAIDPQMNSQMRNHKPFKHMPGELEHAIKCKQNKSFTLDDITDTLQDECKSKNVGKYSPYKSSSFKKNQTFSVEMKDNPKETVAQVTKKKNSCHNCGSTDHYANVTWWNVIYILEVLTVLSTGLIAFLARAPFFEVWKTALLQ
ncbi:hypothetical protein O181_107472 [Austropuccinia psidii MF-1]|uniref:Uncharacterized protein n=1 Tax=Austropuccinia psidii MF-1 TaxID=1389203 RepID=A0A9Q3PPE4_9BASI|nr:hypothetical protein [Austropuccinia psidii MF-1]